MQLALLNYIAVKKEKNTINTRMLYEKQECGITQLPRNKILKRQQSIYLKNSNFNIKQYKCK